MTELLSAGRAPATLLADLAVAVGSDARLDDVLEQVVSATRELLSGGRATLLLLDDDGQLSPAVSVSEQADHGLWTRFRAMPPIPLDVERAVLDSLQHGRAVVVEDARSSPLVPDEWREAFGLETLALVGLVARGSLCGVLVVDDAFRPGGFTTEQRCLMEGIAAFAATAVRNAADYRAAQRRSRALDRILSVAAALNAAPGLAAVLSTGLDALVDLLEARSCALHLVDDEHSLRTLATRGTGHPAVGRHALADADRNLLGALRPAVTDGAQLPAAIRPDGDACSVLAVRHPGVGPDFLVVADRGGAPLRPDVGRLAVSVAEQVWLAVERALIAEERDRRMAQAELLHRLADELAVQPSMQVLVEGMAPLVRGAGVELVDVHLRDRRAARVWGCPATRGRISTLVSRWQRQQTPLPAVDGGLLAVPMLVEGAVVGAVRVRPISPGPVPARERQFLVGTAAGMAHLIARLVLADRVASGERELAVVAERERIAAELQATVGRLLVISSERLRSLATSVASPALRTQLGEVTTTLAQARNHVGQTVDALTAEPERRQSLPGRLRALGRALAADGGAAVDVRVEGRERPVEPAVEAALYRAAHEALRTLQRQARSSTVVVRLRYDDAAVQLLLRDDGLSMAQRTDTVEGLHVGLPALRRSAREVGGQVELGTTRSGLQLAVTLPAPG